MWGTTGTPHSPRPGSMERGWDLAGTISRMGWGGGGSGGGQLTCEQSIGGGGTLAAEWYTGKSSVGYVNPGAVWRLTSKLCLYTAYQIGNSLVTKGNHQFLWEFGYNFN